MNDRLNCKLEDSPHLLNSVEAAARLGLKNSNTLAVWRCHKRYPELEYIKIGRAVRYRPEAIDAFLRMHTVRMPAATSRARGQLESFAPAQELVISHR